MKNLFESIAVALVFLLSLLIVYLIVQYNLIEDDTYEEIKVTIPVKKEVNKKEKTTDYIQNIEGYSDVDVEVDPTKENTTNRVIISDEEGGDNSMQEVFEDGYVDKLEGYSDEKKQNKKPKEKVEKEQEAPASMPDIEDKIGSAIDNLLGEL